MNISSTLGGVTNLQGPRPLGGGQEKVKSAMQAAAKKLGLSDDALRAKLKSGSTLAGVARDARVSTDDLKTAMTDALKRADGVDASSLADDLIAGKGPRGPRVPGGPPPSEKAQKNLVTLAGELGVDTDTLLAQMQSGDLSSLLSAAKSKWSQAATTAASGGVQVDTYA